MLAYFQRRHAPGEWVAKEPAAEHEVVGARGDRLDQGRDARGVVLVVGMEHDHDVRPGREGRVVAGLLVAAVALVLGMDDDVKAELPGDVHGLVARHVIDEDDLADEVVGDVGVRSFQRPRRVVGGHDDDDGRGGGPDELCHGGKVTRRLGHGTVTNVVQRYPATTPRKDRAPMFERLFGNNAVDPAIAVRIPPGQYRTEKFPVLHYGSVPKTDLATWDFRVYGEVDAPFTLTWDEFKALPASRSIRTSTA
ncbi:MAG: hypothetical protein WKF78_10460 [Candidatus Limnocylindrales bacterium]